MRTAELLSASGGDLSDPGTCEYFCAKMLLPASKTCASGTVSEVMV